MGQRVKKKSEEREKKEKKDGRQVVWEKGKRGTKKAL
jgi:hypothetical protein